MALAPWDLERAVDTASQAAGAFGYFGIAPGSRVAVVGETSTSYLLTWMALQLAGAEVALLNPAYPPELMTRLLTDLQPGAVVWVRRRPDDATPERASVRNIYADDLDQGFLRSGTTSVDVARLLPSVAGIERRGQDIAGYMHTSGTSGTPKFCAQSHDYFLRLGRFVADSFCLSRSDTVLAPLPMFHINPLGYGVVGGLTGNADILTVPHFSAREFWPTVISTRSTVLILHAPHVEILKRNTTPANMRDHQVRLVFYADGDFLERFGVPLGVSCYGSTEAGGLTHTWVWRRGDRWDGAEGMVRYGGRSRGDVAWCIDKDGEILLRGLRDDVLSSGYRRGNTLEPLLGADGWFHTGDLGRIDEWGNLIFIERRSESIKVMGEFVPISYVEGEFAAVTSVVELSLWRRRSKLVDDELILYVVADRLPLEELRQVAQKLPPFMRPHTVVRVASLPRDTGVGKVRRRELGELASLGEARL
jgi:carnitine-CoA ligase